MKKLMIFAAVTIFFAACTGNTENTDQNNDTVVAEDTVIKTSIIEVGNFDAEAEKYAGKEIKVKGVVDHVCKHGGKRLFLVDDNGNAHIESEERFDENLNGSKVVITGIVETLVVDEAYCSKLEDEKIQKHKEGDDAKQMHKKRKAKAKYYRDSMKNAGTDSIVFYSIKYVSHEVIEETEEIETDSTQN